MELDYYEEEDECPKCGHYPTRYRPCNAIGCDDGWIDCYDEDPINLSPGEELERCAACHGMGVQRWCPACRLDINLYNASNEEWTDTVHEEAIP